MCLSAFPAQFSGTTILVNQVQHSKHGDIVVVGYQNTAKNNFDGPNAMLLFFPAKEAMGPENFIDTSGCPKILDDVVEALQPKIDGGGMRELEMLGKSAKSPAFRIFKHDIYQVAMVWDTAELLTALAQIDEDKRPNISDDIQQFATTRYHGWSAAVCCFNNRDAIKASPLLMWYRSADPSTLYAPAIDAHDGKVPNLARHVYVDHWIAVGSERGERVRYSDQVPAHVAEFLPTRVVGKHVEGLYVNGDFAIDVSEAKVGNIDNLRRITPHGQAVR